MPTIPLMNDHHSHPLFYAAFASGVCLNGVHKKAEALEFIQQNQSDTPIKLVHGWQSHRFQFTDSDLESLPPVVIFNISLHSLLTNQAARKILLNRYGNQFLKVDDKDWYESNLRVILNWFANLNADSDGLILFYKQLLQQGIYSAEELLLVDQDEIDLFDRAGLSHRTKFWAAPDVFDLLSSGYQERVSGIKLFTDGAIGSGTAAISRSYKSSFSGPENFGMLIYEDDELENAIQTSLQKKAALAIHAIGDRAIEQVICGLEKTGKSKLHQKCVRIEHAQLIHPDQARRVKDLGVTLSMQPNFSSDSAAYSDRLDSDFCQSNNPFRMLIDEIGFIPGQDLIFGSDGMPHGAEEALNQSFFPPLENQRIQLDEFVAGYCTDLSRGQIEFEVDESLRKIRIKQIKASF